MAVEPGHAVDLSRAMVLTPSTPADWLIVGPVAIPIVVGAILMLVRHETRLHAGIAITGFIAMLVCSALLLGSVLTLGPQAMTMGRWLPPFGISFTVDVLGASLALVATLAATVCALYATADIGSVGRRYG